MTRAFIIGNGPSLTREQLELLQDEVTFGVNRIHLLYDLPDDWTLTGPEKFVPNPNSVWATKKVLHNKIDPPSVPFHVKHFVWMEWVGMDDMLWREAVGIHLQLGSVCHLSAGHRGHYVNAHMRQYEVPQTRIEFYDLCQHGNNQPGEAEDRPEEWHLPLICRYGGSLAGAIQIAVREGYGPLYLIGCDLGFKDGAVNHFHPDYTGARVFPAKFLNERTEWAHTVAFRSSPVPIYNCTPGGKLEVYPRKKLDKVLGGHDEL